VSSNAYQIMTEGARGGEGGLRLYELAVPGLGPFYPVPSCAAGSRNDKVDVKEPIGLSCSAHGRVGLTRSDLATMTGQHMRSESATATATRPHMWRSAAPSCPASTVGPAKVNNLRSALRGLSISDASPQSFPTRGPISPMSGTPPPPERNVRQAMSQRNGIGAGSGRASEEAAEGALSAARLGQLKGYTQRLRAARVPGSDPRSVDSAYDEFSRVKDEASDVVETLVGVAAHKSPGAAAASTCRRARNGSVAETVERLESMSIAHGRSTADGDMDNLKASFSTLGLADSDSLAPTGPCSWDRARHNRDLVGASWSSPSPSPSPSPSNGPVLGGPSLAAIRDWREALVKLLQAHRMSLAATIQAYDREAGAEVAERALDEPDYRAGIMQELRTREPPSPAYWPLYERRFQHYDTVRETIMHVDGLLRTAATAADKRGRMSDVRDVRDYVIAPRGNAVLEFANTGALDMPLLRFRVSSHMLAETSPIFEAVFRGQFSHPRILDRDLRELDGQVPREPPRSVTCADGSSVKLYSMPQLEPNKEEALAILLLAAHMQNDKVPRDVSLARFTAIAEVCLRYQCTSPLELLVEHCWLPSWVHKATDTQPDGLLLISYAFGLRRLFTRMSKTAVLNIVDEEELRAKPWPKALKDKIWAVRGAKLAQVYSTCASAVREYFQLPGPSRADANQQPSSSPTAPLPSYIPLFSLTSTPRCPKGDHWCDATSLGWLLLVLNELQLIWTVIDPSVLPCAPSQPHRSLAQLLDVLRSIPSPRHPAHPGSTVCDPTPAFRAAVNDVYNSISGLTLFDVDGKRHGWALSKHRLNEPQTIQNVFLGKLNGASLVSSTTPASPPGNGAWYRPRPPSAFAPDEALCLRIMRHTTTFDDLHALALVSPAFYAAFKNNELALMRPLVGAWRRQTLSSLTGGPAQPQHILPDELARLERLQARSQENPPGPSPPPRLSGHQSIEEDSLAEAAQLESSCSIDMEDGRVAGASDSREGQDPREMTEEEVSRVLWPDQTAPSNCSTAARHLAKGQVPAPSAWDAVAREDSGDKFLAQDLSLLAEDKSLAVLGDKSLGEDLDRRKGINSA
jgi:hypothetical protein